MKTKFVHSVGTIGAMPMNTSKIKHSELPWKGGFTTDPLVYKLWADYDKECEKEVLDVFGSTENEAEENFKFVTKAINNYYELLEACKEALDLVKAIDFVDFKTNSSRKDFSLMRMEADLRQAIQKAED